MRILKLQTWREWDAKAKVFTAGPVGPPHPWECKCRNCTALFIQIGLSVSAYLLTDCAMNYLSGVPATYWVGTFQAGWGGLTIMSLMWLKERKEYA